MLKRLGYDGEYKIVIDVDDVCLDDYVAKYGAENLLVFDKNQWLFVEDTAMSKDGLIKASPFYARVVVDEYASRFAIGDYIVLDDDIIDLRVRMPDNGSLRSMSMRRFNDVLSYLFEFMNENDIYGLSFAHPGMFIGGVQSFDKVIDKRVGSNIFLLNSERRLRWKTIFYDDFNTCLSNGQIGRLVFTIPYIQIHAEPQGSQSSTTKSNGMGEAYAMTKQFTRSFYSTMLFPSSCSTKQVGKRVGNWWPSMKLDNQFQKIVSDKFRR